MSARITAILYILVYFELGAVLMVSPWTSYWSDNLFLAYLVQRTGSPNLLITMNSVFVRACVTGLGVINVLLGLWEAFRYRDLVHLIEASRSKSSCAQAITAVEGKRESNGSEPTAPLSDHRSEGV